MSLTGPVWVVTVTFAGMTMGSASTGSGLPVVCSSTGVLVVLPRIVTVFALAVLPIAERALVTVLKAHPAAAVPPPAVPLPVAMLSSPFTGSTM